MKKTNKTLVIIAVLGATLSSCYYHNWETLHPNNQPVTKPCTLPATVSYSVDIAPIISANCSLNNSSCHSSGSSGGDMTAYPGVANFCGTDSTDDMYLAITWSPPYSNSGMPQTGNRLSQCDINKIVRWMNQSYPNN